MVRTGIGSTRADVNVSCKGGTRVEIKGVAHVGWMPELTHNEAYRQWALLAVKESLNKKIKDPASWTISHREVKAKDFKLEGLGVPKELVQSLKVIIVNLPGFKGIMSHFTQPGRMFADEISERLKVIACIEQPNMAHSEMIEDALGEKVWAKVSNLLGSQEGDAQLIFWGPEGDIKTGLETIEERCKMAFAGVPNETRKSFEDGTTIFERVLPGADRMYPDTDSAPIPLEDSVVDEMAAKLPLVERAQTELNIPARFTGTLLAHTLKHIQRHYPALPEFSFGKVYDLLKFLVAKKLDMAIAKRMLYHLYQHPKMDFDSILVTLGFKLTAAAEIEGKLPFLVKKYKDIRTSSDDTAGQRWVMGNISKLATGNVSLSTLSKQIKL
jgi:glutamyl-tRNA(Gln) amidotransferase subunit E